MAQKEETKMEKIISLTKRRGFVYQGSEIYGGLAGTWDYGPYGVALKNNIKDLWWRMFVDGRDDMYGVDAAILMHPKVWEASGHVGGFSPPKLPFGLGQIGKAFRNEIAPRDFIFRAREFEQMEVEYFVRPEEWEQSFELWRKEVHRYTDAVGLPREHVHEVEVPDGERAHYSKRTIDFEFDYPFGRKELWGLAYRTDFDLSAHE